MIKTPEALPSGTPGLPVVCSESRTPNRSSTIHCAARYSRRGWWRSCSRRRHNRGLESNLYFWRDRSGNEIDVLLEEAGKLVPVEIKAGATVSSDFFRGLDRWKQLARKEAGASWLVYGGKDSHVRLGHRVVAWSDIGALNRNS